MSDLNFEFFKQLVGTLDPITGEPEQWQTHLYYMAKENRPLFRGTLENDWWKAHTFISWSLEKNFIERCDDEGFTITQLGISELQSKGYDTTPHPKDYWDKIFESVKSKQKS
jgi:hypothetical protein